MSFSDYDPKDNHPNYVETIFYRRLLRDCVKGPAAIKNSGELYLPMPAGWRNLTFEDNKSEMQFSSVHQQDKTHNDMLSSYLPWSHSNPVYRAYLQRAKFPDIVASTLRLMLGIATKNPAKVELPARLQYLEDDATFQAENLKQLFSYLICEICCASKNVLVVDYDETTTELKIATYTAESNTNWDYEVIDGVEIVSTCSFVDTWTDPQTGETLDVIKEFCYIEKIPHYKIYVDDKQEPVHVEPLMYKGRPFTRLPVFPIGSLKNHLENQNIPLSGIADIAITLYQISADLRQAQFMTCNPTLFIFGATEKETPTILGTQVVVSIKNPQARAEYPQTDTSAFEHLREMQKDLHNEAVSYGASLITSGAGESGEALSLRKSDSGASLVHIVNMVGEGILTAIEFIAEMKNVTDEIIYEPSIDFAEVNLDAQDINALVSAWLQGAIDLDSLLDNFRAANFIDEDKTNEDVKNNIQNEAPRVDNNSADNKNNHDADDNDDDDNDDDNNNGEQS